MTELRRPDAVHPAYPMPRVGTRDALAAFDRGEPVIVERGHLPGGRPALRVRLVDGPAPAQARSRMHPAWWLAIIAGVLVLLGAAGWALAGLVGLVLGNAIEIGGSLALAVLLLAGVGGGTCVTVITIRHHH
jgi:hypothetical protein